jgi:hypothetical protein
MPVSSQELRPWWAVTLANVGALVVVGVAGFLAMLWPAFGCHPEDGTPDATPRVCGLFDAGLFEAGVYGWIGALLLGFTLSVARRRIRPVAIASAACTMWFLFEIVSVSLT